MNDSKISRRTYLLGTLGALALAVLVGGCGSAPPPPASPPLPVDANLLSAAGFKVIAATTTEQREHLQTLQPGRFSAMQRTGVHYYVYPDMANSQIYVGTTKEYQEYLRLHPDNNKNLPVDLTAQAAADRAAMAKTDTAMRKADHHDATDPWFFWPSFAAFAW